MALSAVAANLGSSFYLQWALRVVRPRHYERLVKAFSRGGSSISDTHEYLDICERAATTDAFDRFRRDVNYMAILEHVSRRLGGDYLQLAASAGLPNDVIERLATDDTGSPLRYFYPGFGDAPLSSTVLRYLKVATDVQRLFGDWAGWTIAEIGIGFGGQCRVMRELHTPGHYILFDLPPVLALAERYLSESGAGTSGLALVDGRDPQHAECDLLISNYAFSELTRPVQEMYLDRVIATARRGYVTYNQISPDHMGTLSLDEFVRRVPGAKVMDEQPLTAAGNAIVYWDRS